MRARRGGFGSTLGGAERAAVSRYSRRVRWMKVLLPVAALGLVAAIFVAGRTAETGQALLSAAEIAALGAGLRVDTPRIAGRTDDGSPFILRADWAEPDGVAADKVRLERPSGELTLADGRRLEGKAAEGRLQRAEGQIWFDGGVELATSDGYRFETERLRLLFSRREAESPGPVFAEGPSGSIAADTMQITQTAPAAGGPAESRIVFQGGVRVLFIPPQARPPEPGAADAPTAPEGKVTP